MTENKDTLQTLPRHFRVEITEDMAPEVRQEAVDANHFLMGLSAIDSWREKIAEPKLSELQTSPNEASIEDVNFINHKTSQVTYLLGLMQMIPSVRLIEEENPQNVSASLSESFLACFGENFKLPQNFELSIENTRKHIVKGIERYSKALEDDDQKKSTVPLKEIPGNFWRIVATANHDIRNPIGNINIGTSMIIEDFKSGIENIDQNLLSVATGSVPRLNSALEESFYLLSNEFPKDKVYVTQIQNEVDSLFSTLKRRSGVDFEMKTSRDAAEDMGFVLWSKTWLQTLLSNVYQNEAKAYGDKKSGKVSATISTEQDWLVLVIEDDAGGIQDDRILQNGFDYGYGGWQSQEESLGKKVESTKIGMAGQVEMIRKYSGNIIPENYTTEGGKPGARIKIILPLHK